MKDCNLIAANANTKIAGNHRIEEIDVDLNTEWFIEQEPYVTSIPNEIKIKYLDGAIYCADTEERTCICCGLPYYGDKISKQKIKLVGVWDVDGYFEHKFDTPEKKQLLAEIIGTMREKFFHGKYVCVGCPEDDWTPDKDFKEQLEAEAAVHDVKAMYAQQEGKLVLDDD